MKLLNIKKQLKREILVNSVNNDKIWSKELTIKEIRELLDNLKNIISKYKYKKDKNFFIDGRREIMLNYVQQKDETEEEIKGALFNFWEFVNNEYCGSTHKLAQELNVSNNKLHNMWDKYNKRGIICLQEKEEILKMINILEDKISQNE